MKLLLATLFCCIATVSAEAHWRPRHDHLHHRNIGRHHHRLLRVADGSISIHERLIQIERHYLGDRNPTRFRGEWCGAMMGLVARKAGIHVPANPNLAKNWAHAGPRLRHAVIGAIAVFQHHVGVIEASMHGLIYLISGNYSHKVGEGWYSERRLIAVVQPVRG